ncbi:hypothetical protein HRJ34_14710 [Rhizorhabdus wittichii]|uniref:DUF7352 domain-containing protein n=1 Tax=Rhizorhabdus wittichii TaxID=160791 RepID=A0A975CYL5_9SPHN|nr:hypothetical protein [Rhizorhabdus wittichii]QTH19626.1 hypothetical protein HRJ34_14710 [Rhizorhabdus wittichii]
MARPGPYTFQVWKFPLEIRDGRQSVSLPGGSRPLSVANQHGRLVLWAAVRMASATGGVFQKNPFYEERFFHVVRTGVDLPEECVRPDEFASGPVRIKFLGTAMFAEGRAVFHVFEEAEPDGW